MKLPTRVLVSVVLINLFLIPLFSIHAQESTVAPEFKLNAAAGKFAPSSNFYFLDSMIDKLKLATNFSQKKKMTMRMNIADEKMVEMKMSLENKQSFSANKNLIQVTKAAKSYKDQVRELQKALEKQTYSTLDKERLLERISQEDEAFVYLLGEADEKTGPIVHDAWSRLQDLKRASS